MPLLEELRLAGNDLSGTIPSELGNITGENSPTLRILDLCQNRLSGAIPPRLGNLTSLQQLHLDRNQLSGAIPPELGNLTGLAVLDLSDNELSCDIPDLSPLSQLSQLRLQNNYQLGGTLSESLADSLQLLNISCTSIPPGDWPDRIPNFLIDPAVCMGTVEAACPSPEASRVDTKDPASPVDTEDPTDPVGPVDPVPPPESPQSDGGGGCAIASNAGAGETSKGIVFDLILVMSALLVIPWRNHSAAKKT